MKKIRFGLLLVLLLACSKSIDYLPQTFFGYSLKQKLIGNEAEKFVNRLHLSSVTKEKNEIGFYESGDRTAIIYITYYDGNSSAEQNFKKMTDKISPENSVFMKGSYLEINDKNIYRTFGMGQTHYVFVVDEKLFWISVETVSAENFLKEYLNFIN